MVDTAHARLWRTGILLALLALVLCAEAAWGVGDPRFAISGGANWAKFDEIGASCWLDWSMNRAAYYAKDDYPYLRMYWRTTANEYTDAQIQDWARTVKAQYGPGVTAVWSASNEPNDRGQANQTPTVFADGYYQYYKNLKIGDPDCKVIGPGILDWTFLSTSVWQKGKDWYEEFRQVWASNPTYSAYSMSLQGNPYPPMDAFNMHTYDLRGVQGTAWVDPDWKYLRDETTACYNDLQTYPETRNLKIWNTEYGSLRAGNLTESADTLGGFCLWLREQPYMERWFFFILSSWDGSWSNTILLNYPDNTINALGKAHYALSTMGNAEVYNMPFNADYTGGAAYTRPGATYSTSFLEDYVQGLNLFPMQGQPFTAGLMRGRTYSGTRRIRRLTLNYRMTCDTNSYRLEIDIPGHTPLWTSGTNTLDQWADIDLSAYEAKEISIGLYCTSDNTYTEATRVAKVQVNNITLWYDNTTAANPVLAKAVADGRHVRLDNMIVSAVCPSWFAVQSPNRSSGIVAIGVTDAVVGTHCTVEGDMATVDGSRVLLSPLLGNRTSGDPPKPLLLNTLSLGGGPSGLQSGVVNDSAADHYAAGLSNVGLLIRTAGKVTYLDPLEAFFYLDDGAHLRDGSGQAGVKVLLPGVPAPLTGATASVTAVSRTTVVSSKVARLLVPGSHQDLSFSAISNYLSNGGFETGTLSNWTSYGSTGGVQSGNWLGGTSAHVGSRFFGAALNGSTKTGGIYQRVAVPAGLGVGATVWSRVFHSGNPATSAQSRVGIEPNGGTDPSAATVEWSPVDVQDASSYSEWRLLTTPSVTCAGGYVTIFLDFKQFNNSGWHINSFDDAKVGTQ